MTTTLLHDNVNDNDNEDDKSQYYYDVQTEDGMTRQPHFYMTMSTIMTMGMIKANITMMC